MLQEHNNIPPMDALLSEVIKDMWLTIEIQILGKHKTLIKRVCPCPNYHLTLKEH